jgi:hypothetical protein
MGIVGANTELSISSAIGSPIGGDQRKVDRAGDAPALQQFHVGER